MSYNTRNIKNTCFLLSNDSKFTKTEPAFDKCSTKFGVLQKGIRQSIEPLLLIKKPWIISLKEFFLVKLQACLQPATLLKMTPPQDYWLQVWNNYFVEHVSVSVSIKRSIIKLSLSLHSFLQKANFHK